jgi:hypothetical protein
MRAQFLFLAVPLTAVLLALPAHAQRASDRLTSPGISLVPTPMSDSVSARMRAFGLLPQLPLVPGRYASVDTTRARTECPMPVLRPDSAKQFSAVKGELPHSSDRMPTIPSSCTNPLDKGQKR